MTPTFKRAVVAVLLCTGLAACQSAQPTTIMSTKSPVELRAMQSRAYDTTDRNKTLRTIVATLQDLGYSINKVDADSGTVTATKFSILTLTASIYPRGTTQTVVRTNAIVKLENKNTDNQVDEPAFYQQFFFEPLSKAMFLTALQVDDSNDSSANAAGSAAPASAAHQP